MHRKDFEALLREVAARNLYYFFLYVLWNLPNAAYVFHNFASIKLRHTFTDATVLESESFKDATVSESDESFKDTRVSESDESFEDTRVSESDRMIIQESCSKVTSALGILAVQWQMTGGLLRYDDSPQAVAPFQCGGKEYSFSITRNLRFEKDVPWQYTDSDEHRHLTSLYDTIYRALRSDMFLFLETFNTIFAELSIAQIKNVALVTNRNNNEGEQFMQLLRRKSAGLGMLHIRLCEHSRKVDEGDRTAGSSKRRYWRRYWRSVGR